MQSTTGQTEAADGVQDHSPFRAWLGRHRLTPEAAGPILGTTARAAKSWLYKEREVPALALRVMRLIDEKPQMLTFFRDCAKVAAREP